MSRRFVNMIVDKYIGSRPCFSLHRINPWSCFYPTAKQALAAPAAAAAAHNRTVMEDACLPRAAMSFYIPERRDDGLDDIDFMSLGRGSNQIITMDQDGNTLLCEASSRAIGVMPSPHKHKLSPISLVVGDRLYLLDSVPGLDYAYSFEALMYSADRWFEHKWYWHSLPPPPFGSDYDHEAVEEEEEDMSCSDRYGFQAYTVVGDSQIWISTVGSGTYSFNTTNNMWSKAGKWALPFNGPVKYAPEHGLWFGFSSEAENGQFAASDLTAASTARPPVLKKLWDELAQPLPERWVPMVSYLHPLGAGKFCIVRTFETPEEGWCWEKDGNMYNNVESFAVFTGVEVERGRRGALRMIKHKSRRYSLGQCGVLSLL